MGPFVELDRPRAHVVVDDFFDEASLRDVFADVRRVERSLAPGLVRDVGHDGQSVFFEHPRRKNRAVWLHEPSRALDRFRATLWSGALVQAFADAREPLFQIVPQCWAPHLQVSSYLTGDHYDFHEDEGAGVNLTAIVFLARDPSKVKGGDLELAYDGEVERIPFRNNRLVVFPSKTLHRVTRVRVAGDDPRDARISLQCWLTFGRPTATKKQKTTAAAEADRPTFLLSEEPIVATAQALVATDAIATEALYWGAFYVTRILAQNLRALAHVHELRLSPIKVRRGERLEVYGTARLSGGPLRVGFALRGPEVVPSEALSLFVEAGKGASTRTASRPLPLASHERAAGTLLGRLLGRVGVGVRASR